MAILEIRDGTFSYTEERRVFEHVSFSVNQGEVFTILGPNGAGKSTLLSCLARLNHLSKGEVFLEQKNIMSLEQRELAGIVGFVPQVLTSAYDYSVMEYVVMGRAPYISVLRKPKEADYIRAAQTLEHMGISDLSQRNYNELSGGERQQVAIARILVQDPALIMLDEPTSALDFGNQIKVVRMAKALSEQGYAIIMTTHVPDHAVMLQGKVGILDREGHMVVGQSNEIVTEEILSNIYQVDVRIRYMEEAERNVCMVKF